MANYVKKLFLLLLLFIPSLSWGATSFSSINQLNLELNQSSTLSNSSNRYWFVGRGYGSSFSSAQAVKTISFKIKNSSTPIDSLFAQIFGNSGAFSCSKTDADGYATLPADYDGIVTFTFSSTCNIPASTGFYVQLNGESGASFQIYGNYSNYYGNDFRAEHSLGTGSYSYDSTLNLPYLYLTAPVPTSDGIYSQVTPLPSSTNPQSVSFTGFYTNGITVAYDRIEIYYYSSTFENVVSVPISPASTASSPYSFELVLPPESYQYEMRLIKLSTGDSTSWTSPVAFDVVASPSGALSGYEEEICDSIITDFSGCVKNALVWAFVPSPESLAQFSTISELLSASFPFAYFYDVADIFDAVGTGTSSSIPELEIDFSGSAVPFTATLFSATTLQTFVSGGTASFMRSIIELALWLGFAWFIYHTITNLMKHKS